MHIRFLEGRLAGETAILPFHVARPLIEARRVEAVEKCVSDRLLNNEQTNNEQTVELPPPTSVPVRGKGKRASALPKTQ